MTILPPTAVLGTRKPPDGGKLSGCSVAEGPPLPGEVRSRLSPLPPQLGMRRRRVVWLVVYLHEYVWLCNRVHKNKHIRQ